MNREINRDSLIQGGAGPLTRPRAISRGRQAARSRQPSAKPAAQSYAMLYLRPQWYAEPVLEFCSFDATYIEKLCAGDARTEEHFVGYFTELLQLKLRSRLQSPHAVEDVRQETFVRVLKALRKDGGLRQADRLGAFVNTVCNNVLLEQYRSSSRVQSLDAEGQPEPHAKGADALDVASARQMKVKVRQILMGMPLRDRQILQAVFLDERDREEICAEFGVDREYFRVLLHRAKQEFKVEYLKRMGGPPMGLEPKRA
jgi:RNA polymerase sigma-70 factor, ECF subfamily